MPFAGVPVVPSFMITLPLISNSVLGVLPIPKNPDKVPPINLKYFEFAIVSVEYVDNTLKKLGLKLILLNYGLGGVPELIYKPIIYIQFF
jgi:hypothetical protein